MILPSEFSKNIISIYGEQGKKWLANLPSLITQIEYKLGLKAEPCFANLSFNYVAPAKTADGKAVVLKLAIPNPEFKSELMALEHFNGFGAVKLIYSDLELGVMLLNRITPGICLEENSNKEQHTQIAVELLQKLHKPTTNTKYFLTLADWFLGFKKLYTRFDGQTGPFPKTLIDHANKLSQELINSMNQQILLHGDLHYGNILYSEQEDWLAIDPKGVIGEPEFEIPLPRLEKDIDQKTLLNNLHQFIAVSSFDKERVTSWLFVKSVLAAWWSFEDSGEIYLPFLQCANIIKKT